MPLFNSKYPSTDLDNFTTLVLAACDAPDMKMQIMKILELEAAQRVKLINSILTHLSHQRAPTQLIEAIACLKNEAVAEKVKELIAWGNNSA
ncbi:MAG: hypothetical protein HQM13_17240 [SAR324 cluster bacterium]|nr:hypothetical protein [SAR324 cluster bacterium]